MNRFIVALLAATTLSPVAHAADDPAPIKGANDTRIRTVDYSDHIVTRITSTDLVPVTITYGEGEKPTLIAGLKVVVTTVKDGADAKTVQAASDACTDWCADRHANELTLQPLKPDTGSMLVVTTERDDGGANPIRHHYAYELRTRTGVIAEDITNGKVTTPTDKEAYFRINYTYSAEDAARRAAEWLKAHKDDAANAMHQKVQDKLAIAQFGGNRNNKWTRGDSADCNVLAPRRISDNGQMTTLYFPMNTPVSVPNVVNPDKERTETLLSWHPEKAPDGGDLMVIHSVPQQFVLRRANQVCLFVNHAFDPDQKVPATGTATPEVVKETKR